MSVYVWGKSWTVIDMLSCTVSVPKRIYSPLLSCRCKNRRTQETPNNYAKVYWLPQLEGNRREKEREYIKLSRPRQLCVVLGLLLERTLKKMGLVSFRLLTSSWLVFNCPSLPYHVSPTATQKTQLFSSLTPVLSGAKTSTSSGLPQAYKISNPQVFFLSFLITMSALAWLFRDCLLYLFI